MRLPRKLRCVLMGDQSLLIQCGDILNRRGHAIAAVITESHLVATWAAGLGIEAWPSSGDLEGRLATVPYDWFFSIANLRLVPDAVRRMAAEGAANFHDGPLPAYAGLNAPTWAILNGETRFGVTWHALTEEVDAGDIYARQVFDLTPDETAFTLNSRCFEAGIASFGEMLEAIEDGTLEPTPQDLRGRTYFGKRDQPAAAGLLRFDQPVASLERLSRALDFGPGYANPLLVPKLRTEGGVFRVGSVTLAPNGGSARPGAVLALDDTGVTIAAADGAVRLQGLFDGSGQEVAPASLLRVGQSVPLLSEADASRLTEMTAAVVRHEDHFKARLQSPQPLDLLEIKPAGGDVAAGMKTISVGLPPELSGDRRIVALLGFLARASGQETFDLAFADDAVEAPSKDYPGLFAPAAPMRVRHAPASTVAAFEETVAAELANLRRRRTVLADLFARWPGLPAPRYTVGLAQAASPSVSRAIPGCALTLVVPSVGTELLVVHDEARLPEADARALVRRLDVALKAFATDREALIRDLPLMSDEDRRRVVEEWNDTARPVDRTACVHTLIERQGELTPDAVALAFEGETITFHELEARANQVAHALARLGVGPDRPVGLYAGRSLDLVVGALGIQKAGGAYVPLDPDYPADRLAFMIEDSGLDVVLTQRDLAGAIPGTPKEVLRIEDACEADAARERVGSGVGPENLAYVIYTSGSTGRPKGVMIEHRQVVNFFAGMDERVAWRDLADPVWLAVTSLSFDISVLELFWTLSRGFKVVIGSTSPGKQGAPAAPAPASRSTKGMDFGLFFWGNDDGPGPRKYQLLLEGAKFADAHGFHAVWTPERHFHAFGGPYPNPAVTGAAVAAVTRNLSIRAGSCVLPLHHPARVAEEWAVLDNISNGRVAVAFASGWMPEDFLLRPENAVPHNKAAMVRDIDVVRRLWRGEAVPFEAPGGRTVDVVTQPRPVQKELPIWVTTAGNPDTYREAARLGANVLTHLLGQSIDELADKIKAYRAALVEAGRDPADHKVTLMLHTLLGADREEVRERAREPMKSYLRSAAALIKQYAWAFPAFKKPAGVSNPMEIDLQSLDAEEMDAILEFAFQRYFEDSGLFGTVEDATARVGQLQAIGVDEIACLIDFGVASEVALERLQPLAAVVETVNRSRGATVEDEADYGIAAQIRRYRVTHLQCTPSMASMLLMNPEDRLALADVRRLYIGGEALSGSLLADLRGASAGTVENMYGPTETTIWSSTETAEPCAGVVPLGRPIANTQLYALDELKRPVPPGCAGELYIGGEGVARGYLNRPELTAERFLQNPFVPGGRMYRTGDLVRFSEDGTLGFLGRVDHQVKVRGHRIELGEIEAGLRAHPAIRDAVAVVREDRPGDVRIVAYLQAAPGVQASPEELRLHLATTLPDFMIPARYVTLDRFPLTPNAKVDRKALPRPEDVVAPAPANDHVPPVDDVQKHIAETFRRILGVARVGLSDNFFSLGGHSLLAVQAHRELKSSVAPALTITDLFRFQTVGALASHVVDRKSAGGKLDVVADRAALRRSALGARGGPLRRAGTAG